jgi:hypothetical protein
MRFPDPFSNDDPLWQPYSGAQNDRDFSQPDQTARTVKDFLRSDEMQHAMEKLSPPKPASVVERRGAVIGHIPGSPTT